MHTAYTCRKHSATQPREISLQLYTFDLTAFCQSISAQAQDTVEQIEMHAIISYKEVYSLEDEVVVGGEKNSNFIALKKKVKHLTYPFIRGYGFALKSTNIDEHKTHDLLTRSNQTHY